VLTVTTGTGNGNLTLDVNGATANGVTIGPANNVGTITNAGTGAGNASITGTIGANVTGITENSTTFGAHTLRREQRLHRLRPLSPPHAGAQHQLGEHLGRDRERGCHVSATNSITTGGTLTSSGIVSLSKHEQREYPHPRGGISLNTSTLNYWLAGNGTTGSADRITATGAATITGTSTLDLLVMTGQTLTGGTYTLVSASGGLTAGGGGFTIVKPSGAGFDTFSLANSTTTQEIPDDHGQPYSGHGLLDGRGQRYRRRHE